MKQFIKNFPIPNMESYASQIWPFAVAQVSVRVFYFFLAYSSIMLFFQWDYNIISQPGIFSAPSLFWMRLVDFSVAFTAIKLAFIAASLVACIMPQWRIVRIISFITLLEFVAIYFSLSRLDVDWYTSILAGFLLIFLPDNWGNPEKFSTPEKKQFLLVFWGVQAFILLTYSMAGIGKLYGGIEQLMLGQSTMFEPKAGALHIADRLVVTNSTSPLGPLAIENYLLLWPFFLGTVYLLLFSFLVAFRPRIQKLWALGLLSFHVVNYLIINIGFTAHSFTVAIFLLLSPFAVSSSSLKEIVLDLPLVGTFIYILPNGIKRKILR